MKYIAMSDLHLGQDGADGTGSYSLLSNIPRSFKKEKAKADDKMAKLSERVKAFANGEPLTLIITGDLMDLSLAYFGQAYYDLVSLLKNLPEVSRFIYVVGNHDHHIWTMFCEHRNIIEPMMYGKGLIWGGGVYTPTFGMGEPCSFLKKGLENEAARDIEVKVAYPSSIIQLNNNKLYFTHGHLFGGLYNLVSRILSTFIEKELDENKMATMNVALIELIYWYCGETGEGMGANGIIEALFADAEKGKDSLIKQMVNSGVEEIFPDGIVKGIPDSWERSFVKYIANKVIKRKIKDKPNVVVSKDRHEDPEKTIRRVKDWVSNVLKFNTNENITFVSGHTHRSAMAKMNNVSVYNLGGWLVDAEDENPDTELLMIDNDGSINMERI
jgi:UDP-2,3-diacylglucosamine pyrophosphatase LpxH